MTIYDEILAVANKLANEGKKPSVALIKTKLSQPVPLPQIINALKTWQHDPDFVEVVEKKKDLTEESDAKEQDISSLIEHAIQPLRDEIKELKALVNSLIDKT